jgi:hypothetical protein
MIIGYLRLYLDVYTGIHFIFYLLEYFFIICSVKIYPVEKSFQKVAK